jgi:hypothetical protein
VSEADLAVAAVVRHFLNVISARQKALGIAAWDRSVRRVGGNPVFIGRGPGQPLVHSSDKPRIFASRAMPGRGRENTQFARALLEMSC